MPRSLKLYVGGVVTLSVVALVVTTLLIQPRATIAIIPADGPSGGPVLMVAGIAFWTVLTLVASALPVTMPRGTIVGVSIAPIVAAMALGGPTVAGWGAALGTTEGRGLRGGGAWYR